MKRNLVGAVCAGLMVAGAAVALNPGAASAGVTNIESGIVDPTGAWQPLTSQYGNKYLVRVTSKVKLDSNSCTLSLSKNGDDSKPPVKSTFSLRSVRGEYVGTKTTTALKNGDYYALTNCSGVTRADVFTITNAPPLVISGLASCYQSAQGKFIRPNGLTLDNGKATKVRLTPSTETAGPAPKGTVSKFSVEVYNPGPYTATLTCGGTAGKPQRSFEFSDIAAPNRLQLIAD